MENANGTEKPAGLKAPDPDNLWRLDTFIDPEAGPIMVHTKVDVEGVAIKGVARRFYSSVNCAVNGRPLTLNFEIKAESLVQAIALWLAAALNAGNEFEAQQRRALLAGGGSVGNMPRVNTPFPKKLVN